MLSNSLTGRLTIELVNGQIRSIVVEHVIVNTDGEPILLRTTDDVYYNWNTIIAVQNNSTPQEKAAFN